MDILIKIVFWAAVVGVIYVAGNQAYHHFIYDPIHADGVEDQKKIDTPIISGLTKARDDAIAANKHLSEDVETLRTTVRNVSLEWEKADNIAKANAAEAQRILAGWESFAKDAQQTITKLKGIIDAPRSAEPCTGICAEAWSLLRDIGVQRHSVVPIH